MPVRRWPLTFIAHLACLSALGFTPDSSAVQHPVLAHMARDRRLVKEADYLGQLADQVLALGAARTTALILPQHGLDYDMPCPHCGAFRLEFVLAAPDRLTCRECGMVVDEHTLPLDQSLTGQNLLGETVTYHYHQREHTLFPIPARIRFLRHERLAEAARALAERYHQNRDPGCANLAAAILQRFAEVYPHWPVIETTRPRTYSTVFEIGPPRPYDHWGFGRWGQRFMYEIPQDLVFAYDLAYDAPAWTADGRQRVEDELLRPAYQLSWQAHEDNEGHVNNLNATFYDRAVHLGRVLNDPDIVHYAVQAMIDMGRMSYQFDGMEYEGSVTYHGVVTGRLGIAQRMLAGYTDPAGYVDERFGLKLQNADFNRLFPGMGKAWHVWSLLEFPNGNPVCIHDTNWAASRQPAPPGATAPSYALNAYGHFVIGRGTGPDAMQAHLHFCPRSEGGHFHADRLSLILWAAGEELLPDIGYVHVGRPNRYLQTGALGHNTVEVLFDEPRTRPEVAAPAELPRDPVSRFAAVAAAEKPVTWARSNLLAYDDGTVSGRRVQMIAASSPGPAWMQIERRERTILMIAADDQRSYLVDLFRVAGGNTHQFVLRPTADEDVTTQLSLDLVPRPGTLAGPETVYGKAVDGALPYSWLVHDLRSATTAEPWQLAWTGHDSRAMLRAWFAPQPNSEVILAQSPSMRRGMNDARQADNHQSPHLLIRRHGATGLSSTFAAVYDASQAGAEPLVREVTWLALPGAVALRVKLADRVDTVYFSDDDQPRVVGGLTCRGRAAVVTPHWTWVREGAAAQAAAAATLQGPLAKVLRQADGDAVDGFEVAGDIRDANSLIGQWCRVLLGDGQAYGYRVTDVSHADGSTRFVIDGDPGFALTAGGSKLLYNPFFEIAGDVRLELARSAFAQR